MPNSSVYLKNFTVSCVFSSVEPNLKDLTLTIIIYVKKLLSPNCHNNEVTGNVKNLIITRKQDDSKILNGSGSFHIKTSKLGHPEHHNSVILTVFRNRIMHFSVVHSV